MLPRCAGMSPMFFKCSTGTIFFFRSFIGSGFELFRSYDRTLKAIDEALERMEVDYIDTIQVFISIKLQERPHIWCRCMIRSSHLPLIL